MYYAHISLTECYAIDAKQLDWLYSKLIEQKNNERNPKKVIHDKVIRA